MKNGMKKAGWTIVSLLPVLLYFGIQMCCAGVVMVFLVIKIMLETPVEMGVEAIQPLLMQQYFENIIPVLIFGQIVSLLVFGLWYYFAWGKKKRPEEARSPKAYHFLLIIALGIMLQFAISALLSMVEMFAPGALQEYEELMEMAGLTEFSVLSLVSTVLMAPLNEELACRGVIFRLAKKVSPKFWVANFIQALAFGILHGNLIQGSYAFVLGLILGLIYREFQNIWLCMLLHAAMNGSGVLVAPVYNLFPESMAGVFLAATMVLTGVLAALCLKGILNKPKTA